MSNKNIKYLLYTLFFEVVCSSCHAGSSSSESNTENDTIETGNVSTITTNKHPYYIDRLISSYPSFILDYNDNYLFFNDGTKIVCDDGKAKSFIEKLDNCDIEDMFSMQYRTDSLPPLYLNDCGRGRNEELFKMMYGKNESEVRKNLVYVEWFGKRIMFSKINGASIQLEKVKKELTTYPELIKYLTNASSFYWRKVRGANRQSAHSYGIAIDINTQYSNYWLWSNPKSSETDTLKYENRIPLKIVEVFERYGFIWGGRWYHYDTMHFEYRPEFFDSHE